ncbi:MAG: hypothetical protein R2705_19095 [Ilumatobacteraceae bacterium]
MVAYRVTGLDDSVSTGVVSFQVGPSSTLLATTLDGECRTAARHVGEVGGGRVPGDLLDRHRAPVGRSARDRPRWAHPGWASPVAPDRRTGRRGDRTPRHPAPCRVRDR